MLSRARSWKFSPTSSLLFKSFFLAGFECATGYNERREWIDQIHATHHDEHVYQDYLRLTEVGIRAVREGVRWPLIDQGTHFDFSSLDPFIEAANQHEMGVIWDLFHYGFPIELNPLNEEFHNRFVQYTRACAAYISKHFSGDLYITPVNEPSYFSWAGGEVGKFAPYLRGQGYELKVALCRAAIDGINAIWEVAPEAQIVNVDPLCHVVPPLERPELADDAEGFNNSVVFQSWDMIAGLLHPELGGSRKHLGVVGINYYWTNQWELGVPDSTLSDDDDRKLPLRELVKRVYERYGGELIISETSHVGDERAGWIAELTRESEALLKNGIPLRGVCLYPILGMPEWHHQSEWTLLGLWDVCKETKRRTVHKPMLDALRSSAHLNRHAEFRYSFL